MDERLVDGATTAGDVGADSAVGVICDCEREDEGAVDEMGGNAAAVTMEDGVSLLKADDGRWSSPLLA